MTGTVSPFQTLPLGSSPGGRLSWILGGTSVDVFFRLPVKESQRWRVGRRLRDTDAKLPVASPPPSSSLGSFFSFCCLIPPPPLLLPPPSGQHLNHNCVTSHNRSHAQRRQRWCINPPGRLEGWMGRRRWIITISLFAEHFAGELFTACLCLPRSDEAAAPPRTGEALAKQTQRMGKLTQTVATIRKKHN